MSETIELIKRHGSVRRYKPDPVPAEMVEQIAGAARQSSTSSNLQMYSVVAVTDEAKKDRMADLCGDQQFIREAPVFLAWCADLSRLSRVCERQGYEQVSHYVENFLLAAVDTAIVMQTAALAAESLGLGMCFVGAIRNRPRDVIALLNLPHLVFPLSGMALGWPVSGPLIRPRLPLDAVLHWEEYDTYGEEDYFRAYDEAMIATGIYDGRQVQGKPGLEAGGEDRLYGWAEHSARRASKALRVELSEVLREQGFHLN
jgi:FMN reductase (NADPH)